MPLNKVRQFLDENDVKYVLISHSPAYTAQEIAESAHVSGKELAKTVIVDTDLGRVMAVLPASKSIHFDKLAEALKTESLELASEDDFREMFPDCEIGAMPPFGSLYNMDVFVAEALTQDKEIAFNAGSHKQLIKMSYKDYERLVKPKVVKFAW